MCLSPLSLWKQESVCLVSLHSVCIKAPLRGAGIPAEAVDALLHTLLTAYAQVPLPTGLLPPAAVHNSIYCPADPRPAQTPTLLWFS